MRWLKKLWLAATAALVIAGTAAAQPVTKIVFDAVATGQTGAMQTGSKATGVTITFCGTGFTGDLYVDSAATAAALAQVWTTSLAANSDCTTTYSYSPASKWYRVRWTRSAGTLNAWMAISTGGMGGPTGPVGGFTAGQVVYADGASSLAGDAGLTYDTTTDVLTAGAVTAKNLTATGLATPGAITVTPTLTQVATITTVAGASLVDGDYFTVKYDGGTVPIEFDLSPGDGTSGGRIPLLFTAGDSADLIRDNVILALNAAAPTKLTASSGGAATVALVLDTPGATGDTNTENVADAGFAVTGFADPTHATTVTYQLVACLADGSCTEPGADSTTGTATATLSASNYNALSWSAVSGAASYKVYRKVAPTSPATVGVIYAGTALAVDDTGLAGGGETAPTVDGTGRLTADSISLDGGSLVYDPATDTLTATKAQISTSVSANGYSLATPNIAITNVGTDIMLFNRSGTGGMDMPSGAQVAWAPTIVGIPDLGLARSAAGVLKVTDGSTGDGAILVGDGSAAAPSVAFAGGGGIFQNSGGPELVEKNGSGIAYVKTGYLSLRGGVAIQTDGNTFVSFPAAATVVIGNAPNATPVANTLIVGESGSGTNIAGANGVIQSGAGTGAGAGSHLYLKTPTAHGSDAVAQTQTTRFDIYEGTTIAHTDINPVTGDAYALGGGSTPWYKVMVSRATLGSKSKTLTDASATDFATIPLADGAMTAGEIIYRVTATISGEKQVLAGRVRYSAIRDNTDYDCDASEVGTQTGSVKSGTLSGAVSVACSAGVLTFSANFDSSLTAPTVTLNYRFDSTDTLAVTPL